jgi:hypothetical protein
MAKNIFGLVHTMLDDSGALEPGGTIEVYAAGTTTQQTVYSDRGLTTSAGYQITADAAGRLPERWIADSVIVKLVYKDSAGATLATRDYANELVDGFDGLPQFYLDDYYETTWEAALDAANTAAVAAGGGVIRAWGREEYAFTAQPSAISAGVYVEGIPNFTRFKLPSGATTCSLLRWAGALGASCTLASNAATGAETIVLTGTSLSIDVGDVIRIQKTPGGSITLGFYTQLTRIEAKSEGGGNTTVTLAEPLEFAVQTSDTYTIRELDTNVGGGASGIIFDGAGNSATEARGVYAIYCEGMYFDELGGENIDGGSPMDGTTVASVVDLRTCYDTRGLNNLWAWRSGSANICALQFREMGPTSYGKLYLEQCYGFGYGWYDSTQQHVDSIIESGSYGRSGKAQCVLGFSVKSVRSAKARYTGFAFTEGSRGHVNYASYHPTDAQFFTVTSIVRASNVSTITFASSPFLTSNVQVVIAGATGADTFNGTFALTRVSDTVYTYANTGTNETAGGTITCQLNRSPSLWCNDTGVVAVYDVVDFRGVTNPAGDVHTGSTDSVRIGVMRTEASFSPTYGGTAGSSAQGTGRHIFDVNGVSVVPNGLTVTSGALTVSAGQLTVTNTGAVPARFFADNFNYVVTLGNAASSSTVGFNAQAKDSGGTNQSFIIQNAAGTARLNNGANTNIEILINGSTVGRFNAAGGLRFGSHDVLTAEGGTVLRSFTAANIAAVANAVNTTGKVAGLMVYDTTNNRIMIASGSAAASAWYVADASASVTPS